MELTSKFTIVIILAIALVHAEEDEEIPHKFLNNLRFRKMSLDEFRETTSESVPSSTEPTTNTLETTTLNSEELLIAENLLEDISKRKRKSATVTYCVEIRPNNPYEKPFQVCEPPEQQPEYQPQYPTQQKYTPKVQPVRPVHQGGYGSQPQHQKPVTTYNTNPQILVPQQDYLIRPAQIMVVPHVPVAEPYHVPTYKKPTHHHPSVYRTNNEEQAATENGARTSSYGGGYKKVMKDKYKNYYDDDDYDMKPSYRPNRGGYGPVYQPTGGYGRPHDESNNHGLVITCQPSAVGYTGSHAQLELVKQMETLKNMYSNYMKTSPNTYSSTVHKDIESLGPMLHKIYSEMPKQQSYSGSDGYVPPATYRQSSGDKWQTAMDSNSMMEQVGAKQMGSMAIPTADNIQMSQMSQPMLQTTAAIRNAQQQSLTANRNAQFQSLTPNLNAQPQTIDNMNLNSNTN